MVKELQLRVNLIEEKKADILKKKASRKLEIDISDITTVKVLRKSIDARKKDVIFNYKVAVYINEPLPDTPDYIFEYQDVSNAKEIHIIGFGPAGMYAALRCIELGYKPIVLERGKNVQDRRRDLRAINQEHFVNEDSNYCFGEGGAGTYSDGKLYTRSLKRGDVRRIFENLVYHGAAQDILIDAHPHIGTNKLPKIIENIRENIIKYGGEVHFETRVTDFVIKNSKLQAIRLKNGNEMTVNSVILATGHSARDIYELLDKKDILLKAKSFAMGVRVEHPQEIIDQIQYSCNGQRDELLPAAAYSLVHQVNERGVYSFCMCPGGFIVPAATANGEVVVNGMSPSRRNNKFANSGIVVEINIDKDLYKYEKFGALKGLEYQKDLEKLAFNAGGKTQAAPAQRLTDFVEGKLSSSLNETSYQPGLTSAPMHSLLPKFIGSRLRKGFDAFGKKMHGYYTAEANIIGVESRTSSPVNIPRKENLEHPQLDGLYPCGEGGGYAGGIISAAMDGERCAEAAIANL
ncbi:FAD-dependent oxidoreductase [Tenacibaculum finnmarkense genomovar finnmarkense]|uniref:NAD(P)/FAD-dependent oxidoreductase n=1 Tax=Tenacibaculum finnmarkense TaxID=2781243 RepID=UPI001E37D3BB|nr:FAD-dependent oxidoreductase [Tenacibaculum finnmarkense]MCD8416383.1 FAD-dependent oxidoreductase [Tenacibaculum finnmarkense genomovar finnmarkense]MCG8185043.1 FAD-dependent oxidoreductase [Tenacibaculum finnmarkense genomovar finnmarkense]MCG8201123.1 FAD-dependent oxidoreductase [Tenacibaculum finnmarkense genomovar finnmarkense]MCG8209002.1 FAD-dependent oxidoreductase [Tenacibaculum finnmarkense genomovar finnmarkense]MCG8211683.1 FAD-dependent oxidoreductase [Tenacibaculum finnmarke